MADQDSQETNDPQESEQTSKFGQFILKLGDLMKYAMITIMVLGVLGFGGAIGYRYLTEDHRLYGQVGIHQTEEGLVVVTVSNEDSKDWYEPTITINDKYKFRAASLNKGRVYNFDITQFATDGGERFRLETSLPKILKIQAGWNASEWSFK